MPVDRTIPHTVWYWDKRGEDVAPYPCQATFDNADEAEAWAQELIESAPSWLSWVKVFRASNESYVTFSWHRDDQAVKSDG